MGASTERSLRGREHCVCQHHGGLKPEVFSDQFFKSECNKYRHVGQCPRCRQPLSFSFCESCLLYKATMGGQPGLCRLHEVQGHFGGEPVYSKMPGLWPIFGVSPIGEQLGDLPGIKVNRVWSRRETSCDAEPDRPSSPTDLRWQHRPRRRIARGLHASFAIGTFRPISVREAYRPVSRSQHHCH